MKDHTTPIGGFIGLETAGAPGRQYHETPALSTGRACLRHILQHIKPDKVWLPFYVCDTVLQPLHELGIAYHFYRLDEALEIQDETCLQADSDLILYVNYFGIKRDYIAQLAARFGSRLVVDDTQAFFRKGSPGLWSFNSARKFFGVPDGAYLYMPDGAPLPTFPGATPDYQHLINRISGDPQTAYQQFLAYEESLDSQPRAISSTSEELLAGLDYSVIAQRRRQNFMQLQKALNTFNRLNTELSPHDVPLYYPLLTELPLRERLIERRVFVPQLWPEILTRKDQNHVWERHLASNLSPLPLDQRYDVDDMNRIITEVSELLAT